VCRASAFTYVLYIRTQDTDPNYGQSTAYYAQDHAAQVVFYPYSMSMVVLQVSKMLRILSVVLTTMIYCEILAEL